MEEKVTFEDELQRKGNVVYRTKGTSMMPLIREGRDAVVLEKRSGERLKKYDVVLYKRGGKYILHRILKVKKESYVLCGDHLRKREYGVTDGMIIGRMTSLVRDGKTVDVNGKKYRAYVHLWCDLFYARAFLLYIKELSARAVNKIKRVTKRDKK